MKPQTRALLDMAGSDLTAARRDLVADDPRPSVSRSYYAAFHAACAALDSEGLAAKTHSGTHNLFADRFVRTERLDKDMSETLSRLMQLRQGADYHVGQVITMDEAADAEVRASGFVATIEALLGA